MHIAKLIHVMVHIFLLRIGAICLQLGWFMWLVRVLPVEQVGAYAVVNAVWFLARALGPLGFDLAFVRYTPQFEQANQVGKSLALHRYALMSILRVHVPFYVVVGLIYSALSSYMILSFSTDMVVLVLLGVLGHMLMGLQSAKYIAVQRQTLANLPESMLLPGITMVVSVALAWSVGASLMAILLVQAVVALVIAIGYGVAARRLYRHDMVALSDAERRSIRHAARGMWSAVCLTNIMVKSPLFVISAVLGGAAAALFEAAQRFTSLLGLIHWCVGYVTSPMLAKADAQQDEAVLQDVVVVGAWLSLFAAGTLGVGLIVLGEWLLELVAGANYVAAYATMVVIICAQVVNASSGVAHYVYMMRGKQQVTVWISAVEVPLIIGLLLLLCPLYGVVGGAWATLIAVVFRNMLLNLLLPKKLGLYPGVWSVAGITHAWRLLQSVQR